MKKNIIGSSFRIGKPLSYLYFLNHILKIFYNKKGLKEILKKNKKKVGLFLSLYMM